MISSMKKATSSLIITLYVVGCLHSKAQTLNWTIKNPGSDKGFVENKGQFLVTGKLKSSEILFAACLDNVSYYFTSNGYTIVHTKEIRKSKTKKEEQEYKDELLNREFTYRAHEVKWENSNGNTIAEGLYEKTNYYSFGYSNTSKNKHTVFAKAYQKLIYKDIYPNTDLLFEFAKDTCGIKYTFILRPGATINSIKMHFPLAKGISIDKNGDLIIKSEFGNITDHSPEITEGRHQIPGTFSIENNTVCFVSDRNIVKDSTIIDPWVVTPNFTNPSYAERVLDIDYDTKGNVYAAISGYFFSIWGVILAKYNNSGVLQWSYAPPFSNNPFGDFAVDRRTNNIFIGEGSNNGFGARIVKINSNAVQTGISVGDKNFFEIWRIVFDNCNTRAVVSGGGISWPSFQTCLLDTSLSSFNYINFSGTGECCHDVNMLALDNYGNSYQTTVEASSGPGWSNKLTKLPLPNFLPYTYSVNTNYDFEETVSIKYTPIGVRGFNGITLSDTSLYLYDSYVLRKFGTTNGNLLNLKRIKYPPAGDSSKIYCGGLTSNDCYDIFLGDRKSVLQFDANLNQVNSFAVSDTIFELKLDLIKSNLLYIGGKKFLSAVQINGLPNCGYTSTLNITTSSTSEDCTNKGSASVVINGTEPPYTIQWNTLPIATGTTITGLSTGSYVVSVSDNACYRRIVTDTIYVGFINNIITTITTTNSTCNSINNGAAIVNIVLGPGPFNYAWSTGQSGSSNSLDSLSVGNYSVVISNSSGCRDTLNFIITEPAIKDTFNIITTYCETDKNTTLKLDAPMAGSPYTWYYLNSPINNSNTPELFVPTVNLYNYYVTWFNSGCKYISDSLLAIVIKSVEFENIKFTNVFTPNDDGVNDVFYPISRSDYHDLYYNLYDYEMVILNRWGIKIFSSNLRGNVWDGRTTSGEMVSDGSYFWILTYKNKCSADPEKTNTVKGVVQLIR